MFATIDLNVPVKKVADYSTGYDSCILRGVFPNKQSSAVITLGTMDGSGKLNRIFINVEQATTFQIRETFNMFIPVIWDE